MTKISTLAFLCFTAAAGCGNGSSGPGKDWSDKPLEVTIKQKVKNVPFTIKAPKGMKLEADRASDITLSWKADVDDYFSEPSFMISYASIPAKTLDDFVKYAMVSKKDVIAKKAELPDGFVLIHHKKNFGIVTVKVLKRKGEHAVSCRASQAKGGGVPSPQKTIAWLEKLCMSLQLQ